MEGQPPGSAILDRIRANSGLDPLDAGPSPALGGPGSRGLRNPFKLIASSIHAPSMPEIHLPHFSRDAISRLPREVLLAPFMGKSKGEVFKEIFKEVAVSAGSAALLRIALTTITGGASPFVGAGVGAGVAAIREIRRQAIENQTANPDRKKIYQKILSLGPGQRKRLIGEMAKGAAFGALGFELVNLGPVQAVGNLIKDLAGGGLNTAGGAKDALGALKSNIGTPELKQDTLILGNVAGIAGDTPLRDKPILGNVADVAGGALHNIGLKAHELSGLGQGNMPWDANANPAGHTGYVIEAGPNSPEIKVPENLPPEQQWIAGANDINQDYGLMKQAEVGKILPKIDEFLASQGFTEANTSPDTLAAMRDHLQHVAEARVNSVYDTHLQEAVTNHMSLAEVQNNWHQDFSKWVEGGEMIREMTPYLQVEAVGLQPGFVEQTIFPPLGLPLDSVLNASLSPQEWRNIAPKLGSFVAANIDPLNEAWHRTFPTEKFPVQLEEISDLVYRLQGGDFTALEKLKSACKGLSQGERIRILNDAGYSRVWEILEALKK